MTTQGDGLERTVKAINRDLRRLFWELVANGWSVTRVMEPAAMDDIALALERGALRIWILHDRGTPLTTVGAVSWTSDAAPTAWRQYLTGIEQPARARLDDELAMLRADLPAIADQVSDGTASEERLQRIARGQLSARPPWRR